MSGDAIEVQATRIPEAAERVRGLPEDEALPEGEEILWQGSPDWRVMARHTFKVRWVSLYFAVLICARIVLAISDREGAAGFLQVAQMAAVFGVGLGILLLLAYLNASAAVYSITNKRVVMHIGVAIPVTWNLPFARLAGADLNLRSSTDGDVVLSLGAKDKISWLFFFPHVQPGGFFRPKPTMRFLPAPEQTADVLQRAFEAWAEGSETKVVMGDRAPEPSSNTNASRRPRGLTLAET